MREYLESRIEELKKADTEACEKRWDKNVPMLARQTYRELSNELTARRRELEDVLKELLKAEGNYIDYLQEILVKSAGVTKP